MLLKFLHAVMKWCEKRGRVLHITGTSPDDIYLIRYYLIRSRYFNIFLHVFLRSDRDDFHDHPWNFMTLLVRGSYVEDTPCEGKWSREGNYKRIERTTKQNRLVFRKASQLHKVLLKDSINGKEVFYSVDDRFTIAPLTFFISGPVKRAWGFRKDGKWVYWKTYLGVPESAPDRG